MTVPLESAVKHWPAVGPSDDTTRLVVDALVAVNAVVEANGAVTLLGNVYAPAPKVPPVVVMTPVAAV